MRIVQWLVAAIVITGGSTVLHGTQEPGGDASRPTEVLHKINEALAAGDRTKQGEIVAPYLALVRKTDRSPDEELALGEIYFLALNPRDSDALFSKHLERSDRIGRMAWIRHQQVQFRGFNKYSESERDLGEFRRRFPVSAEDLTYTSAMVGNVAGRYAAAGDHPRVVELVLEDVKSLPLDLPLRSFRLLGAHHASFVATNRGAEARALLQAHLEQLRKRVNAAGRAVEPASVAKTRAFAHRPGVLHADWDTANVDDQPGFSRDAFNTQMAADRIKEIEAMLAKIDA